MRKHISFLLLLCFVGSFVSANASAKNRHVYLFEHYLVNELQEVFAVCRSHELEPYLMIYQGQVLDLSSFPRREETHIASIGLEEIFIGAAKIDSDVIALKFPQFTGITIVCTGTPKTCKHVLKAFRLPFLSAPVFSKEEIARIIKFLS
jgi:hypothetical protein